MQLILKNNSFSVGILPNLGGALSFLKKGEQDILRPCFEDETEPKNTAMFVMLPYASFIRENHFPYFGITRTIKQKTKGNFLAMHGDIWHSQGEVIFQDSEKVELKFIHSKDSGFPFEYTAQVLYHLTESGLQITLKLTNNSNLPMPFGMGIHPFFIKDKKIKIQYNSTHLWYRDDDPIMGHPYEIPKEYNFNEPNTLPKNSTDISVSGWDGSALIENSTEQISLQADSNFRHLILYSPKNKNYFCLEPVTHTPDAFNLASRGIVGTGIQSLGPHESTETTITLNVKGIS